MSYLDENGLSQYDQNIKSYISNSMTDYTPNLNRIEGKIDALLAAIGTDDGIPEEYYITSYLIDMSDYLNGASNIIKDIPSIAATDTIMVGGESEYVDVIKRIWLKTKLYARDTTKDGFVIRELSRTDKTKFSNGTNSTNSNYEYFQKMPEFWYKLNEIRANVYKVSFTMTQNIVDDTWQHWEENQFIGIYVSSMKSYNSYSGTGIALYQFSMRGTPANRIVTNPTSSATYPCIIGYSENYKYTYNITLNGNKIGETRVLSMREYVIIALLYWGFTTLDLTIIKKYFLLKSVSSSDNLGYFDTYGMDIVVGSGYIDTFSLINFLGLEIGNPYTSYYEGPDEVSVSHNSNSASYYTRFSYNGNNYNTLSAFPNSSGYRFGGWYNSSGLCSLLFLGYDILFTKLCLPSSTVATTITYANSLGSGNFHTLPLLFNGSGSNNGLLTFSFYGGSIMLTSSTYTTRRKYYLGDYTVVNSFN